MSHVGRVRTTNEDSYLDAREQGPRRCEHEHRVPHAQRFKDYFLHVLAHRPYRIDTLAALSALDSARDVPVRRL